MKYTSDDDEDEEEDEEEEEEEEKEEEEGEEEGEVEGEGDGGIGGTERRNVFNLSCIRMYDEGSPARFIQQL